MSPDILGYILVAPAIICVIVALASLIIANIFLWLEDANWGDILGSALVIGGVILMVMAFATGAKMLGWLD